MRNNRLFLNLLFVPSLAFSGAWGVGAFENDAALDFSYKLSKGAIVSGLNIDSNATYIDSDMCSIGLAAAEIVAALKDNDLSQLPNEVKSWVESNRGVSTSELTKPAVQVVNACSDPKKSELAQLWSEAMPQEWQASVTRLRKRLQ